MDSDAGPGINPGIDLVVQQCSLEPDGSLQISFYQPPHDLKANGILHMHTLCIPAGGEYDDEIEAVLIALRDLVTDALQDLPNLEALM